MILAVVFNLVSISKAKIHSVDAMQELNEIADELIEACPEASLINALEVFKPGNFQMSTFGNYEYSCTLLRLKDNPNIEFSRCDWGGDIEINFRTIDHFFRSLNGICVDSK